MNVLIVEDDVIVREGLKSIISQQEHEVFVSENINKAIEILNNEIINLVFVDIDLGECRTGVWFGKFLKKHHKNIPFIYTTGNNDNYTIKEALETNPLSYLIKPYDERYIYLAFELAKKIEIPNYATDKSKTEFFIENNGSFKKIIWNDVHYIEQFSENDCKIFTSKSTEYLVDLFFEVEKNLPDYFVKTSECIFVNFNKILQVNGDVLELSMGYYVSLDNKYKTDMINKLNKF